MRTRGARFGGHPFAVQFRHGSTPRAGVERRHHRDAARVTLFCHALQAGKISPAGRKAETIRALQ
jgi:hypothetical protein